MPRELFSPGPPSEPDLTASPETQQPGLGALDGRSAASLFDSDDADEGELRISDSFRKSDQEKNLHPYVQTLSLVDLESCVALENAAFPEYERCSREKVGTIYSLNQVM